jgi:methionyl aminopeptidase
MANRKTKVEIQHMREGGALLSRALAVAVEAVRPGIKLYELDAVAERVIREGGGEPSFLGYRVSKQDTPFPSTVCISVNEEIVHGPGNRSLALKKGDMVGLDIGCWYKGLCTDMAVTVPVGRVSPKATELIRVTRASLFAGVAAAKVGGEVNDISAAVEAYVKPFRYGIVRTFVGHGVGHKVHEEPHVPNFVNPRAPHVPLVPGMCLALEPMVALGGPDVTIANDGWTVVMADGSLGAHFEVTIVLTKDGPEILTPLPV